MDHSKQQVKGLENSIKKLHDDVKRFQKNLTEVGRVEQRVSQDLMNSSPLCQDNAQLRILVEDWASFVAGANTASQNLVSQLDKVWIEPIKRFQGLFAEIKDFLKKREQLIQECEKQKAKVQKLESKERTGTNIAKINTAKQQLASHHQELKVLETRLREDLPLILDLAPEYLHPSLIALINAQVTHTGELTSIFSNTITHLDTLPESHRSVQNQRLRTIHGLSIVAASSDSSSK